MARNYEKRFTGLNRFLEAKEKDSKKKETRPPLYQLKTAEDVKKWIPSIKREIEYLLQQISCPHDSRNYPDHKIEEFKARIEELKTEHQKFVAKVQKLDPNYRDVIPWQPRGYSRKRPAHDNHMTSPDSHMTTKKLCSPLLDKEEQQKKETIATEVAAKETTGTEMVPNETVGTVMATEPNLLGLDYSSSSSEGDD